jgi:hypothetical protein
MPCGGIYYFAEKENQDGSDPGDDIWCLHCGKHDTFGIDHLDHYCHEWDGYLHSRCVVDYLAGDEGQTVINHLHTLELGPNVHFVDMPTIVIESADQPQIASVTEKS